MTGFGQQLGRIAKLPLIGTEAEGQDALVFGHALEEGNEIEVGLDGDAHGDLVSDRAEHETGAQLDVALRPALDHDRRQGSERRDHDERGGERERSVTCESGCARGGCSACGEPAQAIADGKTQASSSCALPALGKPHGCDDDADHGVGLREVAPQLAGLRRNVLRQ